MRLRDLSRAELVAVLGGVALAIGLFLPWYTLGARDTLGMGAHVFHGTAAGLKVTGWQAFPTMRYLLIVAAAAPLILTYIIARGNTLSWPRGEMTAVVAVIAFGLIGYRLLISKPGTVPGQTSLVWGGFVSFAGAIVMLGGSALRASATERPRKPPGVL